MLDFSGMIISGLLFGVIAASVLLYMDASRPARLILAGAAGIWVGLASAAAAGGWLTISEPFPMIGAFVFGPLAAVLVLCALPRMRKALLSLPVPLLVILNVGRVFAVLFFGLEAANRLAGPFPFYAGWGDIITGIVAVPLAFVAAGRWKESIVSSGSLILWNLFGTADLLLAVFLGVTSSDGSAFQLFVHPPGSEAMQHLPFSFVPTVLVPFYLLTHAIVWAHILKARSPAREPVLQSP